MLAVAGLASWLLWGTGPGTELRVAEENPCALFPALDGGLAGWMRGWRPLEPALTCEHFARERAKPLEASTPSPWTDAEGLVETAPLRWLSSDGRWLLLPGGEDLPELALIDLRDGTRRILLTGPSGVSWDDAAWAREGSFVTGGRAPGAAAGTTAPTLTLVELGSDRATAYRGPELPRAR